MNNGTILFFNKLKGFGFIIPAGGPSIYFHIDALVDKQTIPREGEAVIYDVKQGLKGLEAINIIIV